MYTLAFDTTSSSCSVCLYKDKVLVSRFIERMEYGQSEVLLSEIKKMLSSVKITFADLGLVAVCVGPGSFTGVRSSISSARAFGIARKDLPIVGISAFEAYLYSLKADELADVNAVIIETKRDDFYYQTFDINKKKLMEPTALTREQILQDLRGKKVTVIGDGVERFLSMPTGLSLHAIKIEFYPPVENIAICAMDKQKEGLGDFPKPMYLRPADVFNCGI